MLGILCLTQLVISVKISVYDEFVIKHLVKDKIMEITKKNFT